jgi:hypothetical protein
MPSSTKNAMTASMFSTTMRTLSMRLIAMLVSSLVNGPGGLARPGDGAAGPFSTSR